MIIPECCLPCHLNKITDQENLARLTVLREKYKNRLTQLDLEVKTLQEKVGEGEYITSRGLLKITAISRSQVSWSDLAKENIEEPRLSKLIKKYQDQIYYYTSKVKRI